MSIGRDSLRKTSPTTVKASKSKTPPPNPSILVISPPPKRPKNEAINTVGLPKVKKSPFLLETPPQPSGLRPRKRPSLSQSQNIFDNVNFEHAHLTKKPRKDISYYSKPGPATPASKRQNRSINNSLNKSSASNQSVLTTGSNDVCIF